MTSSWFFFSTHLQRCTDKHTSNPSYPVYRSLGCTTGRRNALLHIRELSRMLLTHWCKSLTYFRLLKKRLYTISHNLPKCLHRSSVCTGGPSALHCVQRLKKIDHLVCRILCRDVNNLTGPFVLSIWGTAHDLQFLFCSMYCLFCVVLCTGCV